MFNETSPILTFKFMNRKYTTNDRWVMFICGIIFAVIVLVLCGTIMLTKYFLDKNKLHHNATLIFDNISSTDSQTNLNALLIFGIVSSIIALLITIMLIILFVWACINNNEKIGEINYYSHHDLYGSLPQNNFNDNTYH